METNTTYPYEATSPGVARHQCQECGAWERSDRGPITHSKRCDSRAQFVAPKAAPLFVAAKQGAITAVASEDEILKAVRTKRISPSDALNRDF